VKYNDLWFGVLSRSALSGLREYYQKNESLIESARKSDLSRIEDEVGKIGKELKLTEDEKYSEWNLLVGEHEITYDMFFTNLFRYSCVVLVTLILEDHLNKLSWALYKMKEHSKLPPNPRGDIIATYKGYLDNFSLSYDNSLWAFVDDLRCIRNCIVHSSGDVSRRSPKQQSELEKIAKKNIGVHIGGRSTQYQLTPLYLDDDVIIIEPRYCETTILNVTNLFEALCKAADLPLEVKFDIDRS